MGINWNEPNFGKREIELVTEVLKSGYVSEGPKTKELEGKLAKIVGVKHVIMTTSCTAALYLALEAVKKVNISTDFKSVCLPAVTMLATKNAIELANLEPFVLDVSEDYLLHSFTGYIYMPVNLLGRGVNKEFLEGLQDDGTPVICDNAGCLGSEVPIGDIGCYSLQANKLISCSQGGFCATDSDTYARAIRRLKDFGRENKYDNQSTGFNFKFNDILAAVALGQLETLEERKLRHLEIYHKYKKELSDYLKFMEFKTGEIPLWIEAECPKRDELFEYLKSKDIHVRKPWDSLFSQEDTPNADYYSSNFLWLPTGMHLSDSDLDEVIREVKNFNETKKRT